MVSQSDPIDMTYLRTEVTSWEGWNVQVHWFLVDGRATPCGIEVSSFVSDDDRLPWNAFYYPDEAPPRAITRGLFNRLPVGAILAETRRQAWEEASRDAAAGYEDPSVPEAFTVPETRPGRSDHKYRRAAHWYAHAVETGEPAPAKFTHARLQLEGLAADGPNGEVRTRKWIAEARRRGYLPPAERKGSK